MGIDTNLEQELVRRILAVSKPQRVILFGSAAAGQMGRDSDIDLLVVEQRPANTRAEGIKIRRALGDVGYPVDVIVMASERFEESKDVMGGLAYPAHHEGRVLYEVA